MIKWANENILDYNCDGSPKEEQGNAKRTYLSLHYLGENSRKERVIKKWEKIQRQFQKRIDCQ